MLIEVKLVKPKCSFEISPDMLTCFNEKGKREGRGAIPKGRQPSEKTSTIYRSTCNLQCIGMFYVIL